MWDLFQSESAFLRDHLMALKNVRFLSLGHYVTVSLCHWVTINKCSLGLYGAPEEGAG